jgi:hypothetical protein
MNTPTKKPLGTINLITMAFLLLWAIAFVLFGIRDIRDGDPGSPMFMLGFLLVTFLVVRRWLVKSRDRREKAQSGKTPTNYGGFPALLVMQDSLRDTTGMVPAFEGEVARNVFIGFVIVVVLVGGYLLYRKFGPKDGES